MYCKTITKEIFDSYIANDSDTVLEGAITNTFGSTTFWRFVRVPLAKGEHYVEALYKHDFGSFPLAMGANHFSIKNGLEFMAFIVDSKETCCKSISLMMLFEDCKHADSNWVTDKMKEAFFSYIEKTYAPSAETLENDNIRFQAYESAAKQYVFDRENDTTALGMMLKLLEKFDSTTIVEYLANPTGWAERFAKALEQSDIWDSFAKDYAEPLAAYLILVRQHLDAFKADPSCWESVCKNLMNAVEDRKTVRLNLEANGKTMQVTYPVAGIEFHDVVKMKNLHTTPISPIRHREDAERFLSENYWDIAFFKFSIPFKIIKSVSSGGKVIWENPVFGK